jgi:very-short-patch-repair endonuclease
MREDNADLRQFAQRMRREPTPAEEAVWRLVRNRRLTGFKFRRQHPLGPYILDCYCPAARVVIELDGNSHATPEGQEADAGRRRYLEVRGILVLRFWNTEVAENPDGVAERIAAVCAERVKSKRKPAGG